MNQQLDRKRNIVPGCSPVVCTTNQAAWKRNPGDKPRKFEGISVSEGVQEGLERKRGQEGCLRVQVQSW